LFVFLAGASHDGRHAEKGASGHPTNLHMFREGPKHRLQLDEQRSAFELNSNYFELQIV